MIDLGEKMSMPEPAEVGSKEVYYPTLHISQDSDPGIPESGTMVIRFKRKSKEERKDDKGKETYTCTIEVRSIEKIKKDKCCTGKDKYAERSDMLDALRSALTEEGEED